MDLDGHRDKVIIAALHAAADSLYYYDHPGDSSAVAQSEFAHNMLDAALADYVRAANLAARPVRHGWRRLLRR